MPWLPQAWVWLGSHAPWLAQALKTDHLPFTHSRLRVPQVPQASCSMSPGVHSTASQAPKLQLSPHSWYVPLPQFSKAPGVHSPWFSQAPVLHWWSSLQVLVNSASVYYETPFGEISAEVWDTLLATNLRAPFLLSQRLGLAIKASGVGYIVNIGD